MRPSKDPRGQVLLITAGAMLALMLVAALVFDIGFSVMLRRQEQNAADPGAIAAARFIDNTTGQTFDKPAGEGAACYYARQNGFFPSATTNSISATGCVPANDPSGATLEVNFPPDQRAGQYFNAPGMVQVVLTREQETFFGRVIGRSSLTVTSGAVAARQRGQTNTNSLISLNPTDCAAAKIHGTGKVKIYPVPGYTGDGGYVQVNSDCDHGSSDDLCGNSQGALKIAGTALLQAPQINVHGSCEGKPPVGTLNEAAVQVPDIFAGLQPPTFNPALDGANCGTLGAPLKPTGQFSAGCAASGSGRHWVPSTGIERTTLCPGIASNFDCIHLHPGVYYGGWNIGSKVRVVLDPGIYIMAGGGITIGSTGALDSVGAASSPAPVLIFNTDNPNFNCPTNPATACQDDLKLTAGGSLKLAGLLGNQPCPPVTTTGGCPFGGMVIWHDGNGSQTDGLITISGGTTLFISGTIYAPTASVIIDGNSGTNCGTGTETQKASVQIVAWNWDLGGTGDLCMPYDPTQLYHLTQQGLVH
jgi:hypothetical protein